MSTTTKFFYRAKTRDGSLQDGILEAATSAEVRKLLRDQSLFPLQIAVASRQLAIKSASGLRISRQRVRREDLLLVLSQINIMAQSGVDLAESIRNIAAQCTNRRLKEVLEKVHYDLTSGQAFSQALAKHSDIFDESLVAGITAGEQSGALANVLERLTYLLRNEIRLRSAVMGMLSYPIVLCVVTFGVLNALVFFILPQFGKVFAELGRPAPPMTQFLLNGGQFFRDRWLIVVGVAVGGVIAAYKALRHPHTRRIWDRMCLNLKLTRGPMRSLLTGRTLRLLGTMLQSGVPLLESIRLCRGALGNQVFRDLFQTIEQEVLHGRGMSDTLVAASFLPPGAAQMIATAEHSGKLGPVLQTVGEYYEDDGERHLRDLVKLLEPTIIVCLGGVVMMVVLSVILPLLDVSTIPK